MGQQNDPATSGKLLSLPTLSVKADAYVYRDRKLHRNIYELKNAQQQGGCAHRTTAAASAAAVTASTASVAAIPVAISTAISAALSASRIHSTSGSSSLSHRLVLKVSMFKT